jgi:hypothetical protein
MTPQTICHLGGDFNPEALSVVIVEIDNFSQKNNNGCSPEY